MAKVTKAIFLNSTGQSILTMLKEIKRALFYKKVGSEHGANGLRVYEGFLQYYDKNTQEWKKMVGITTENFVTENNENIVTESGEEILFTSSNGVMIGY